MRKFNFYVLILVLFPIIAFSQRNNDSYDYPVRPGTEEWKQFESTTQMIEACQVPENILNNMSTEGLVETCLNHPLYGDVFSNENILNNFNDLTTKFNCFQELISRPEAGKAVLNNYKKIDVAKISEKKEINFGKFRSSFLELWLTNDAILEKLTVNEQKEILKEILKKNYKKKEIHSFNNYHFLCSSYAIINILEFHNKINRNDENINKFKTDYKKINDDLYKSISIEASKFSNYSGTLSKSLLIPGDDTPTTRYTPRGSPVAAIIIGGVWINEHLLNDYFQYTHPNADVIGDASHYYNCHSYAYHKSEGNWYDNVWINNPSPYQDDKSYIEVPYFSSADNLKVEYRLSGVRKHTANKTNNQSRVYSKWGEYALYEHDLTDVPSIYGSPSRYYVSTEMNGSTSLTKGSSYYYSVEDINEAVYTWTSSNNLQIAPTSSGNRVLVKAVSSGSGWVKVKIKVSLPNFIDPIAYTTKYITVNDGINPGLNAFNVKISPNPTTDYISVDLYLKDEFRSVENINLEYDLLLFDKNNNLILKRKSIHMKEQFNVKSLKKGTYFIQLIQNENKIAKQIIVK